MAAGSTCGFVEERRQLGRRLHGVGELAEVAMDRVDATLPARRPRRGHVRRGARRRPRALASPPLEGGEVEALDRLVDQAALIGGVEHLADDALGRLEREVGDLAADLVDRARRLGVDLLARVLEPPLPLDLGLVLRPLDLGVGDLAGLGQDLRRLGPGLGEDGAVLLEQLARLVAGGVGLVDRLPGSGRAGRRSSSGSA